MKRIVLGTLSAFVLLGATLVAAPRTTSPSTITLNQVSTFAAAADSTIEPSLGDYVSFTVTYPKTVEKFGPRIQVLCYQDGTLVFAEAGPHYQSFLLGGGSSPWLNNSPGPAHCTADLYYWSYQGGQKFNWLASTEFEAGGPQ